MKHCEHELPLVETQSRLRDLFDSSYIDPLSGLKAGGSNKQSELGSQTTIQQMQLGSKVLEEILQDLAETLHTRYPGTSQAERGVVEVEKIWKMIQSENPHLLEPDLEELLLMRIHRRDINMTSFSLWKHRRIQTDVRWMENIFETALNDRTVAWDVGGANILRRFPRKERGQKRQSGEGSNLESNNSKRQKHSGLLTVSES